MTRQWCGAGDCCGRVVDEALGVDGRLRKRSEMGECVWYCSCWMFDYMILCKSSSTVIP